MNNENTIPICVTISLIGILLVSLAGCHETEQTNREAIKAGLVEHQKQGTDGTYWSKE